jgi:hypothetical protein
MWWIHSQTKEISIEDRHPQVFSSLSTRAKCAHARTGCSHL